MRQNARRFLRHLHLIIRMDVIHYGITTGFSYQITAYFLVYPFSLLLKETAHGWLPFNVWLGCVNQVSRNIKIMFSFKFCASCSHAPSHFIPLDLIIVVVPCVARNLWSSSLIVFLLASASFSLMCPNASVAWCIVVWRDWTLFCVEQLYSSLQPTAWLQTPARLHHGRHHSLRLSCYQCRHRQNLI